MPLVGSFVKRDKGAEAIVIAAMGDDSSLPARVSLDKQNRRIDGTGTD